MFPRVERGKRPEDLEPRDFWEGFERLPSVSGVMADWKWAFGTSLGLVLPWVKRTGEKSNDFPCPAPQSCSCRHEIVVNEVHGLLAVCQCEGGGHWDCESYRVEEQDLLIHALDRRAFYQALRKALGFQEPRSVKYAPRWLEEIGTYNGGLVAPVYFSFERGNALLAELRTLLAARERPMILLTPTALSGTAELDFMMRGSAGLHLPLASVLTANAEASGMGVNFQTRPSLALTLSQFEARSAGGEGVAKTLQQMSRNLEAVAKGSAELRTENEELKQGQGASLFKFAVQVDAADFQAFVAVMAFGNRRLAARHLEIPERTIYSRIEGWKSRGKHYEKMYRMVESRKKAGRKIKLRLGDALLSGSNGEENPETLGDVMTKLKRGGEDSRSYPEILRQVDQALSEQNAGNWQGVRDELREMVEEEISQI